MEKYKNHPSTILYSGDNIWYICLQIFKIFNFLNFLMHMYNSLKNDFTI